MNKSLILFFWLLIIVSCQDVNYAKNRKEQEPLPLHQQYIDNYGAVLSYQLRNYPIKLKEVRLWIKPWSLNGGSLYTLKTVANESYLIKHDFWDNHVGLDSVSFKTRRVETTVDEVIENLYELGLKEQSSQSDSAQSKIGDGVSFILELKDDEYYHSIGYNLPHLFPDSHHRYFMKILQSLEEPLDYKYVKEIN